MSSEVVGSIWYQHSLIGEIRGVDAVPTPINTLNTTEGVVKTPPKVSLNEILELLK